MTINLLLQTGDYGSFFAMTGMFTYRVMLIASITVERHAPAAPAQG